MKKKFNLFVLGLAIFSVVSLTGCDGTNSNDDDEASGENTSTSEVLISDYAIPENFEMTLQISDTSIFNKGDPWYYKTAKVGNDWQFIHYDRDLGDFTIQETHFYRYLSETSYTHYIYSYTEEDWVNQGESNTTDMMMDNGTNFSFLYIKPDGPQMEIVETKRNFDTDPTSNRYYIDAIAYEYSDALDFEVVVDANYLNLCLSETVRDGSRICTSWSAYNYTTDIIGWDDWYLENKYFKPAP